MFLSDNKKKEREREKGITFTFHDHISLKKRHDAWCVILFTSLSFCMEKYLSSILFTVRYEREVIFISSFFFLKNAIEKKII